MRKLLLYLVILGATIQCNVKADSNETTTVSNVTTTEDPVTDVKPGTTLSRGDYPYLALIYFMDDKVISRGFRFLRAGILIQVDRILTSAVPFDIQNEDGFPKKTLLARLGRVSTDDWLDINKEAGEQEREIIKIFRPKDYDPSKWWLYDVSVMATLTPFEITRTVNIAPLDYNITLDQNSSCFSVVFHTFGMSEDKIVESVFMKMPVHLMISEAECGENYSNESMVCSTGSEHLRGANKPYGSCLANSGGPLVCEEHVVGTQTYIEPECNTSVLYHKVVFWDKLINCSIKDDCSSKECSEECVVIEKDRDEKMRSESMDAEEKVHLESESSRAKRDFKKRSSSSKTAPFVVPVVISIFFSLLLI